MARSSATKSTLQRPSHNTVKRVEVARAAWFRGVWPERTPKQQALVVFQASPGRRIGEALGRRPEDLNGNVLDLGKTQTRGDDD